MYRGQRPEQTVDYFQPESRWSGQSFWLPNMIEGPQITVVVQKRSGDEFEGLYTAVENSGRYEWRIKGTVRQNTITWRFTEAIEEANPTPVVGHAHVEGKQDGETLELLYRDEDSSAQMHLRRQ